MANTVQKLLDEIERVSFAPSNQVTFSIPDQLGIADEVMETIIQPAIIGQNEGYFIKTYDVAVERGKAEYELPDRAAAMSMRELKIIEGDKPIDLEYMEYGDIQDD